MHLLLALVLFGTFAWFVAWLWRSNPEKRAQLAATALFAGFLLALLFLTLTGRLHWIAAAIAAVVPVIRRLLGLLRYLPYLAGLYGRRAGGSEQQGPRTGNTETMTPAKAREILELKAGCTREEVIAAHRRLMQKVHPDRGGSKYFAQQLNEAKAVLLRLL